MQEKYIARAELSKHIVVPRTKLLKSAGGMLRLIAAIVLTAAVASCGEGLVVPEQDSAGTIYGTITYLDPEETWPPESDIFDLRFVAMRFVPLDTADFLQLNRMEISNRLQSSVAFDTFFIMDVAPGYFPYSGVAYQFSSNIFHWKPVGIYTENDGGFFVRNDETTHVSVVVDFRNPPPFPPEF